MVEKKLIVDSIYKLRHKFLVLGLTGRTGSGCTTVAKLLGSESLDQFNAPKPSYNHAGITNDERKYNILYHYFHSEQKVLPFQTIKASNMIMFLALSEGFDVLKEAFLQAYSQKNKKTDEIGSIIDAMKNDIDNHYEKVYKYYEFLKQKKYKRIPLNETDKEELLTQAKEIINYIEEELPKFRTKFENKLEEKTHKRLFREFQIWGDNIRQYGSVKNTGKLNADGPSALSRLINLVIKVYLEVNNAEGVDTLIIIDALRNPFEVLYFRERYSSFYLLSINTEEEIRKKHLYESGFTDVEIESLDGKEHSKKDIDRTYYEQDIDKCVELSDIHITHDGKTVSENDKLKRQLVQFISLIMHPGLVPPSPQERMMQIAYTAKLNSGCISRQVGAVITDEFFSIKAAGWNTVPEGQTPCSLRDFEDLSSRSDLNAYSPYELKDDKFRKEVEDLRVRYEKSCWSVITKAQGIRLPYCFKDIHTVVSDEKNQVHTRSLHAEENAFLQLAKYGSMGIKGGKLFTTASPCELCSKKAYQLGIKEIYYIDAYPGISREHILECGLKPIDIHLFSGAIGRAYMNLYTPFFALKDELEYLTGVKVSQRKRDPKVSSIIDANNDDKQKENNQKAANE